MSAPTQLCLSRVSAPTQLYLRKVSTPAQLYLLNLSRVSASKQISFKGKRVHAAVPFKADATISFNGEARRHATVSFEGERADDCSFQG